MLGYGLVLHGSLYSFPTFPPLHLKMYRDYCGNHEKCDGETESEVCGHVNSEHEGRELCDV